MIDRPGLVRLLATEPRPPLITVFAPPGYGKTVLLSDPAVHAGRPVGWLTIDDLDNVPSVFLAYLAAMIDEVRPLDPGVHAAIGRGPRAVASALPQLAGELHRIGRPALFVLDDVHRLTDRECLDGLAVLLDYLPPGIQVAMAGRTPPDLPFGRFRARRELLEVRRADLQLDASETAALVAAAGHPVSDDEARILAERTDGWAAGVYLATLADDHKADAPSAVPAVSGREGHVAEYLRSELVPMLGDEDLAFLERTTVLEIVEAPVAEAVAGLPSAEERLERLARTNQLVVRVRGDEPAYRYHNLLREFFGAELARAEPDALPELHGRASAWYMAAGRPELAVEHAIRSGDLDAAAALVTRVGIAMFYGGHGDSVVRWLGFFDDAVFERRPQLALVAAWLFFLNGRPAAADRIADIAERSDFDGPPDDGTASFASGRAMLRAVMARSGLEDLLANATFAAAAEAPGSLWRANALWLLGSAHMVAGDLAAADVVLAEAVDAAASAGATAMVALSYRAAIAIGRGDWRAAEEHERRAYAVLQTARFGDILAALAVYAMAARLALHRGDIVRARAELVRAQLVRPLVSHTAPWFSVAALLELARCYLAISDPDGARHALREADEIARIRPSLGVLSDALDEMHARLGTASRTLAGASTLTAAELRLLPILSTHLKFEEIAERLHVSSHTVKTQARSIYAKLDASSRSEAVERAIEVGLLEPFPGLGLVGPSRRA